MNILFISRDLACGDLCYRLKKEGNDVRLYIEDPSQRQNLQNMVDKISDLKDQLHWVGKDGLIVFDSVGHGKLQNDLRESGYSVVGGSELGDKLEHDRQYGQKIFSFCDIDIAPTINFSSAKDAIEFIKENPDKWVIKQNGHIEKSFNYVGELEDGSDVIEMLEGYNKHNSKECSSIDLQKRLYGIEIGVGRYFNGKDWVGPIEINLEHKSLFNDNLGPKTDEMGTIMWYEEDENNKLFQATIAKLKPYLQKIDFRGDIDINCIVNGKEIYPLEATARFGCPSTQLQSELHISPWGEFLKAVADGKEYDLKYKKGFGIIVLVATTPFPYGDDIKNHKMDGVRILFRNEMDKDTMDHIHFEEVSKRINSKDKEEYYISSNKGYVLHVSHIAETVELAREKVYKLIEQIIIPKMFYRTDIGLKFATEDYKKLKDFDWI